MVGRIIDFGIESDSVIYQTSTSEPVVRLPSEKIGISGVYGTVYDLGLCSGQCCYNKTGQNLFRCESITSWISLKDINMTSSDTLQCRWYRDIKTSPGVSNWVWLLSLSLSGYYSGWIDFCNYDTVSGVARWCDQRPGLWKTEWYFNGVYIPNSTLTFIVYVLQGDIILLKLTAKNTGGMAGTLRAFGRVWGPSSGEQWGLTNITEATINPGSFWEANVSYTIPASMRGGAMINVDGVVTDTDGNTLSQITQYGMIYKY